MKNNWFFEGMFAGALLAALAVSAICCGRYFDLQKDAVKNNAAHWDVIINEQTGEVKSVFKWGPK